VTNAVVIQMVQIGDPANEVDGTGYGAVDHEYYISKYEVTNAEYTAFLKAVGATDTHGLYNSNMNSNNRGGIVQSGSSGSYTYAVKAGRGDNPVNYVDFWDACRFANWLHNGQRTGSQDLTTTENGAYFLDGVTHPTNSTISRLDGAQWFITSEDEWYKAAYYKGGGTSAGYWDYATQSDTVPTSKAPPGTDLTNGSANYDDLGLDHDIVDVGSYTAKPSTSAYGTFDQNGNLWEWNETIVGSNRGYRGGHYDATWIDLRSANGYDSLATWESPAWGIRIASLVPEPVTLAVLGVGSLTLLIRRRRRK